MSKEINDLIYTARWNLGEAVKRNDYGKFLDNAHDLISEAKAKSITDEDEPERPDKTDDEIKEIEDFEMPTIVEVPGISFKKRGHFRTPSGYAKGVLTHYTVSGRTKKSAIAVMRYLASKNLGCPVMDEDGIIYVPKGFDPFRDVAYHAGKSAWKGKSGMSSYMVGMEICCWGLDPRGSDRRVSKGEANIVKGSYQKYTPAQEKALLNFTKLLAEKSPDFDIEWNAGHDEVATPKGRKQDPGASYSMTMPEHRKMLRNELK